MSRSRSSCASHARINPALDIPFTNYVNSHLPQDSNVWKSNGRNDKIVGHVIQKYRRNYSYNYLNKIFIISIEKLSKIKIFLNIFLLLSPDVNYDALLEHPHIRYLNSDRVRVNAIITGRMWSIELWIPFAPYVNHIETSLGQFENASHKYIREMYFTCSYEIWEMRVLYAIISYEIIIELFF